MKETKTTTKTKTKLLESRSILILAYNGMVWYGMARHGMERKETETLEARSFGIDVCYSPLQPAKNTDEEEEEKVHI